VPEGYVITPFGYFHSSCVQAIASSDKLLADGRVQHASGAITPAATCTQPHFAPNGTPKVEGKVTPTDTGWQEDASMVAPAGKSFSGIANTNVVPPNPLNIEGQTLFFFPGLEDVNDPNTSILQPVLAWNGFGDNAWTMANWNCCLSGITTYSTPFTTAPGHWIISYTSPNCRSSTVSCPTWNIYSYDTSNHQSTALNHTPSQGQVFNWAFEGVMEVYGVNNCNDYPNNKNGETYFTGFYDEQGRLVTNPKWTQSVDTTASPDCGFKLKVQPYEITLGYN
jgi:hypothetical protein